jgi:predicted amidohydrolase YtcJ
VPRWVSTLVGKTRSQLALSFLIAVKLAVCQQPADVILLGGRILTVDANDSVAEAVAVRGERLLAVGPSAEIRKYADKHTRVIQLGGKTVVPGLVESHVHAIGVAAEEEYQPYAELHSIAEVQSWIRHRAKQLPAGQWIKVVRTDITRLKERRHPTPAELDQAAGGHPVVFNAARKNALNTLGFQRLGITPNMALFGGGKILRDNAGNPLMIAGGDAEIREAIAQPAPLRPVLLDRLEKVLHRYNEVGITSIFERGSNLEGYRTYQELRRQGRLTTRAALAIMVGSAKAEEAERLVKATGLHQGEGDEWVKVGPLKVIADGGIHWGNTFLRVPYGAQRIGFYRLDNPEYRGDFHYSDAELAALMRMGHRLGWQMTVHVTGDAGVDRVLDAMEAANSDRPIRDRRFTLIHAYFPTPEAVERAKRLGVAVDTQPYLYYRDSSAIAEVYGRSWAERLIGAGAWVHAGIPTTINSDHMIGMDPDHAMNSFNPFLQAYIAVSRRNEHGDVWGAAQKISRMEALRAITHTAAWMSFSERAVGSLEAGKLADLAVLDRDYLGCPEQDIRKIRVLLTMVGGKVVLEQN